MACNRWSTYNKNNNRFNNDSDKENNVSSSSSQRTIDKSSSTSTLDIRINPTIDGTDRIDDTAPMKRETGEITNDTICVKSIGKLFNGTMHRISNSSDSVTTNNCRNSTAFTTNHQCRVINKSTAALNTQMMPSANEQLPNNDIVLIIDKSNAINNNDNSGSPNSTTMANNNFTQNSIVANTLQTNPIHRSSIGTSSDAASSGKMNGNTDANQSATSENEYKGILERKAEWEKRASQTFK